MRMGADGSGGEQRGAARRGEEWRGAEVSGGWLRGAEGSGGFPLMSMGDRAEGLACADPGARTPIGESENSNHYICISVSLNI